MKKIGQYTARGTINEDKTADGLPQKITLFDGSFKTAYRVIEFKIWGSDWGASVNPDVIGKLATSDKSSTLAVSFMLASDLTQIAWATSAGTTDAGGVPLAESIIDPDNLIVEDLYVYGRGSQSVTTDPINYLVILEKYEISDWRGALAMAKDRALS